MAFFRSLGGAIGVSALGAVLAHRSGTTPPTAGPARHPRLQLRQRGAMLDVPTLPGPLRAVVGGAYGDAMGELFLIAAGLAV